MRYAKIKFRKRNKSDTAMISFLILLMGYVVIISGFKKLPDVSKPNIIVILVDDAGYADFGFMGSKDLLTPNIDKLAARSIRFTDAHVTASVCSPSRAGLLTGRYQQRFGYECNEGDGFPGMDTMQTILPKMLQSNGYKTAAFGKWHLGYEPAQHPLQKGFQYFYGFLSGGRSYFYKPAKDDKEGAPTALLENHKQVKFDGYLTDELGNKAAEYIIMFRVKLLLACVLYVFSVDAQIKPLGELWYDTDSKIINAHGGGILYYKQKYYWFGEVKGMGKDGNLAMDGVSCYSSKDLNNWKNEGLALKMIPDTNSVLQPGCIVERPKVIYNPRTRKFVMWFHHELKNQDYSAALTGLAVSDKPVGPYHYIKSIRPNQKIWPVNLSEDQKRPLDYPLLNRKDTSWKARVSEGMFVRRDYEKGQMSRDMTLFVDDDGTAYHIASSEDNQTLHVSKLNKDYTGFSGEYYRILPGQSNEAPAIFKYKNKYYLFTSGTTGWKPNPARSFVASNIYGPWQSLGNPVRGTEAEKATTFYSQSTYILKIAGKDDAYIYLGDRWTPENAAEGKYIWLPVTFENGSPTLH